MTNEINPTPFDRSVLSTLRSLIPNRDVHSLAEAKQVAEHQAIRLLQLHGIDDGPIPVEFIAELPKIEIELVEAPVSGAGFWNGNAWIIQLNKHENYRRQRFTLAHEYKHIIDHNRADGLYLGSKDLPAEEQASTRPTISPDACSSQRCCSNAPTTAACSDHPTWLITSKYPKSPFLSGSGRPASSNPRHAANQPVPHSRVHGSTA